ncbi:MAG: hypothetical protein U0457_05395 [Candidatus Sericytochromatia bacterium]
MAPAEFNGIKFNKYRKLISGQLIYVNNQPLIIQEVEPKDPITNLPRTGIITFLLHYYNKQI